MPTLSVYMTIPLRLLIFESIDEIKEVLEVLSQAGFTPQWRRIEKSDDLAQLHESPDVIVASTGFQFDMAIAEAATYSSHYAELASSEKRTATDSRLNNQLKQLGQNLQKKRQNDKQQLERELEYRRKFEQLLSHLSTHFINLSLNEIDEAIADALQTIGEFFCLDRSYIFQRTDSDSSLTKTHEWCNNGIEPKTNSLQTLTEYPDDSQNLSASQQDLYLNAFEVQSHSVHRRQTAVRGSQALRSLFPAVERRESVPPEPSSGDDPLPASDPVTGQTILVVPIVLENLVGVVGFDASPKEARSPTSVPPDNHRFSEDHIAMLKALASLLVSAIKRKKTEENRQHFEKTTWQEKELAQVTLQSIGDAVITTDWAGRVQYINPVAEKLTGWKTLEARGRVLPEVFCIIDENSRAAAENPVEAVWRSGQTVELINCTVLIARDGTEYAIDVSAAPIGIHQGIMMGTVLIFRDNTQSRSLAHQLSWQTTHDTLTKLVNRRGFEQHLAKAIASAQETQHALCYLDLDQFKVVNDTCGHVAGDELLRQVSVLLRQRVRSTDILARLGGDEFGILLYQCTLQKAEQIVHSLQNLIQNFRFTWDGKTFTIGVSIGLVAIDHGSQDVNSLLGAADVACYAAKDKGGNYIQVYRAEDQELARQRGERQWILKINAALEENRFCLYCQKIAPVTAAFGDEHCEVLLRMLDEEGGLVPPMAFIPAAERYNLMPVIDQWVIRTFFASYTQHLGEELRHHPRRVYTINLSGASVNHSQFLDFLKEQFAQYPIPPQSICFEITETTAVTNLRQAAQLIRELNQLGCRFALDDFGSGMSSLAYLKNLPVDYLKIDGSFVKNITSDQVNYALVECFNRVGQVMGMKTIAEFVENEATLEMLRSLGVDYAQGYGIAKPCPLAF